ncbi:MAG: hypothetical protein HZA78_02410 [Candidatus Schekmanbacteria bacterium]|nr:hypothetical protein [Candidatus Schekmanbacteria bacterium]
MQFAIFFKYYHGAFALQVKVPWWKFVSGPGRVRPAYKRLGGGIEYFSRWRDIKDIGQHIKILRNMAIDSLPTIGLIYSLHFVDLLNDSNDQPGNCNTE